MKVLNGTIMKSIGGLMTKIKVNSPTVCLVGGGICLVGAVVASHYAGRKVDEVLDVHKTQVENLKDIKEAGEYQDENGENVEFSSDDYKKELTHTYISTAWDMTKLYGPVVLLTAGAGVCFVTGNRILAKRLAGMTAAYELVQGSYMRYRQNVIDDLGVDGDKKYLLGLDGTHEEKYHDTKIDEKTGEVVNIGKAKTRKLDVVSDVKDWRQASPYAVRIDFCHDMTKDMNYNIIYLENLERNVNLKLDVQGYLTLYEVYDALGILKNLSPEVIGMSHNVGWIKGRGDGDVRFNLVLVPTVCGINDGVAGNLSEVGLIDFNCIGSIWDKLC